MAKTNVPDDLKYTKDHEWVRVHGKKAIVGITNFAVAQLGDITQLDLPSEGEKCRAGQPIGSVESVKAVSDIFAPVSGTVTKVNTSLTDSPEDLNQDAYDEGWMVEIELSDPKELDALLTADAYSAELSEHE